MVLLPAHCPAGIATQPRMLSAFSSEEGSPEATASDDHGSAQPGQSFPPSAILDEVFSSQASSFEHSSPSISGLSANLATQKDDFAFDFSEYLKSDRTPSPEAHNAIVQDGHWSTTSVQTEDGPSRVSLNVRPFSEYGGTCIEQAELGSRITKGAVCPDNCLVGDLETHNALPQGVQDPFMPSLPQLPSEPSFPELICSVCFQPQYLCRFFASHPRAHLPPNRIRWNETAGVIRSPAPSACHIDTRDRGIYADQIHSDETIATQPGCSITSPTRGVGAIAGSSGTDGSVKQDLERSHRAMPTPDFAQSANDMKVMDSVTASPTITPSMNTPRSSSSEGSPSSSDAKQPWQCELCKRSFAQRCRLKRHMTSVHDRPHKCPHCYRGFGLPKDLERHKRTKHSQLYQSKTYRCTHIDCAIFDQPKFQGRQDNYEKHMRAHSACTSPED